jgi:hypothetical protein
MFCVWDGDEQLKTVNSQSKPWNKTRRLMRLLKQKPVDLNYFDLFKTNTYNIGLIIF